jgi:hypothetical protein
MLNSKHNSGGSSSNKGIIFCFKLSTKDYGLSTAYGEIGNDQCWLGNIVNGRKYFMPPQPLPPLTSLIFSEN